LTDGSGEGFGCGGVWSSPMLAYRGGSGVIVFGTSNCEHPGDSAAAGEIGAETIFGVEAKTGEELWRFRPRDPNRLDDDFGATPNLLPATPAHPSGIVGAAGKDGVYYARDLIDGDAAHTTRAAQSGHLVGDFAIGGMIGSPATGPVQMSWIPEDQRHLVIATAALGTPIGEPIDSGAFPIDATLAEDPARLLSLHALDAATGEIVWRTPLSGPSYGAPALAGNVVFVPVTFQSRVAAFDAATGVPLWSLPTIGAPSSTPVVVADSLYIGTGTRETDAEFKAFGNEAQDFFGSIAGAHPLSPASTISAFTIAPLNASP
ncbi:MAG TPA: PQQ-binding-like beta-propeller repeat protein, partial [Actinomycetota bacterium]